MARLTGADSAEIVIDGVHTAVHSDRILIATGTTPRRPRGLALDRRMLLVPEELSRLDAAPQRLLVLGGNRTARASARLLAAAGSAVTLIDSPSGADLEAAVASGLRTVVGDVLELSHQDDLAVVRLTDGRNFAADAILFAAGRRGATDSIDLAAAGLEADEDGRLWCDDFGRTWVPNIAAVGEVVGFPRWLRDEDAATIVESFLEDAPSARKRTVAMA
jgi:NAD(P) transhydrogenase